MDSQEHEQALHQLGLRNADELAERWVGYGIRPLEMLAWITAGVASTNPTSQPPSRQRNGRPIRQIAVCPPATTSPSSKPFGSTQTPRTTLANSELLPGRQRPRQTLNSATAAARR